MIRIFLAAVDVIPAAVVLIPVFLILHVFAYRRNSRKSILYCLFCLYLSAVFSLVGIPNVTYCRPDMNLNLIPLFGMIQDLKNSLLNILLFVPLGFLLPILWGRWRKAIPTVIFGFGLSMTIELLQLLTYRATDVNDLLTNTLGTVAGFLAGKAVADRYPPVGKGTSDVYVLLGLSFGVMFFLHPFLSPWIWDRIL